MGMGDVSSVDLLLLVTKPSTELSYTDSNTVTCSILPGTQPGGGGGDLAACKVTNLVHHV